MPRGVSLPPGTVADRIMMVGCRRCLQKVMRQHAQVFDCVRTESLAWSYAAGHAGFLVGMRLL